MNEALRLAMAETGETSESLAEQVGVDPKTAARWLTPGRIPHARTRAAVAEVLQRDVADLFPDAVRRRDPKWLREWLEWERDARALRWYEPAFVPGLLQTEAYARATLSAGGVLSEERLARRVKSRLDRQAVLRSDDPPQLMAIIDVAVLRRTVGNDRELMREQLAHLVACAERPRVHLQVVPAEAGLYAGLQGAFILADTVHGTAAHLDHQVRAQIVEPGSEDIDNLSTTWEMIHREALPWRQSLELIMEAVTTWG